jgi:excisionase family DNA binding protein
MENTGTQKYLTVQQVAALLSLNKRTVYEWIWSGKLESVRFSRKVLRVRESSIARLAETCTQAK